MIPMENNEITKNEAAFQKKIQKLFDQHGLQYFYFAQESNDSERFHSGCRMSGELIIKFFRMFLFDEPHFEPVLYVITQEILVRLKDEQKIHSKH